MFKKEEFKDYPFDPSEMAVPLEDFYIKAGSDATHAWFHMVIKEGKTLHTRDIPGGRGFCFIFPTVMVQYHPQFDGLDCQGLHPSIKELGILQSATLPASSTAIIVRVKDGVQDLTAVNGSDLPLALFLWKK